MTVRLRTPRRAAWHRLKYPHLSIGAIASGAPVDFYPREHAQRAFRAAYERTFATHGGDARCGPEYGAKGVVTLSLDECVGVECVRLVDLNGVV